MSGTYAGLRLAGRVKAAPADDMPDDEMEPDDEDGAKKPKSKKKEKPMTDDEIKAMVTSAKAEGAGEANARMMAVFASDEFEGRKELAISLLGTSLTADEIVKQLSVAPKAVGTSNDDVTKAAEEAARAVMQAAINGNKNSAIKVGEAGDKAADEAPDQAVVNAGWKNAAETANRIAGY